MLSVPVDTNRQHVFVSGIHQPLLDADTNTFFPHANSQLSRISNTSADLLFVGLGNPNQEEWMDDHKRKVNDNSVWVFEEAHIEQTS